MGLLGLYRCWCYWSLVIKAISIIGKNLLLFSISRTFFGKFTVWETICSWLFSVHPTATPVLTKQQVSYCLHELFWLNSIVLPDALDSFHHSSCYYLGAHPSRVWCARYCPRMLTCYQSYLVNRSYYLAQILETTRDKLWPQLPKSGPTSAYSCPDLPREIKGHW